MKVDLDGGYVEIKYSTEGKFFVTVAAKKTATDIIVNSAEITQEQLELLVSDVVTAKLSNVKVKFEEPQKPTKKKTKKKSKKKAAKKQVEGDEDSSTSELEQ